MSSRLTLAPLRAWRHARVPRRERGLPSCPAWLSAGYHADVVVVLEERREWVERQRGAAQDLRRRMALARRHLGATRALLRPGIAEPHVAGHQVAAVAG